MHMVIGISETVWSSLPARTLAEGESVGACFASLESRANVVIVQRDCGPLTAAGPKHWSQGVMAS